MPKKTMMGMAVDHLNRQAAHDPYAGPMPQAKSSGGLFGGVKKFVGDAKREIARQKELTRMDRAGVRYNAQPYEDVKDPEGLAKRTREGLQRMDQKRRGK